MPLAAILRPNKTLKSVLLKTRIREAKALTSKIKQGMHLRQPENSSDGAWIFQTLAAMLACAALMFALAALAGFRTGNLLPILLAAGGYVCIAYGVTIRFQKQQWFFLAALVILLLLVLICRQQVLEGYRLFWNQMRNTYTAGTGWVLPEWEMSHIHN